MKILRMSAALAGLTLLTGCGPPETDQIAQRSLIGVSEKKLLACWGRPSRRETVGLEQIWTYPIGRSVTEGWIPGQLPPPGDRCDVKVVIDRYGVSQVFYRTIEGRPLPLGQSCQYPVEACTAR